MKNLDLSGNMISILGHVSSQIKAGICLTVLKTFSA